MPFNLKCQIEKILTEPEDKLFKQGLDTLILENAKFTENDHNAFMYNGIMYWHSTSSKYVFNPNTLHISLVDQFDKELKYKRNVYVTIQQIFQSLLPLIKTTFPITRQAFPDELVQYMDLLNKIERTEPQQKYLNDLTEKQLLQYQTMLPKLHYYLSLRMVV